MIYKQENFQCRSGILTIRGYLLRPQLNGRLPAVIVSHGFAGNTHDTKRYARHFADAGYLTVYYDFCGSGKGRSDGKSTDMSILTEKNDLSAVLDNVRSLDFVDKKRIILAGCSQGGLVSALLAAERADDIDKLILYYPAFCIRDDIRSGKMLGGKFDPENAPQTFYALHVKIGRKYITDAQKSDPFEGIRNYNKPVLICHGTKDRIVSIDYSIRAAKEYPNAKLVSIKNGDHNFLFHGFKIAIKATIDFLKND